MITLHLLEYLKTIPLGEDVSTEWSWEKLLDGSCVAIYSVGDPRPRGLRRMSQRFELECRGESDLHGAHVLERIIEHLRDNSVLHNLPAVPEVSERKYKECWVMDISNIQNLGRDANDRVIFKASARINYIKEG
jgi:hypothetical protein